MSNPVKARRARRNKGYESISRNMLQDEKDLTVKARGILSIFVSLPDDWDVNGVQGFIDQFCNRDGYTSINEGIKELEASGHFARLKRQGEGGRWEWLWSYSHDPRDVAQAVAEWEAQGYRTTGKRSGNRKAVPPKGSDQAVSSTQAVLGNPEHGSVLGKSVDGGPVHGEPPNKEVHSLVPSGQEVQVEEESKAPALRSGATSPAEPVQPAAIATPGAGFDGPDPDCDPDVAAASLLERRQRRAARTPAALNATAHTPAARRLVDAYAATCAVAPAGKLRTQFLVAVNELIKASYPERVIAQALAECGAKGYPASALGSFAHGIANKRPEPAASAAPRRSATDDKIRATLALRDRFPGAPTPAAGFPQLTHGEAR